MCRLRKYGVHSQIGFWSRKFIWFGFLYEYYHKLPYPAVDNLVLLQIKVLEHILQEEAFDAKLI